MLGYDVCALTSARSQVNIPAAHTTQPGIPPWTYPTDPLLHTVHQQFVATFELAKVWLQLSHFLESDKTQNTQIDTDKQQMLQFQMLQLD